MSGLNNQHLDRSLGYDDDYKSTDLSRAQYWAIFARMPANLDRVFQLYRWIGAKPGDILMHEPGVAESKTIVPAVQDVIKRMKSGQTNS